MISGAAYCGVPQAFSHFFQFQNRFDWLVGDRSEVNTGSFAYGESEREREKERGKERERVRVGVRSGLERERAG